MQNRRGGACGEDRDPAAAVRAPHGPRVVSAADEPLSHTLEPRKACRTGARVQCEEHSPAVPVADLIAES